MRYLLSFLIIALYLASLGLAFYFGSFMGRWSVEWDIAEQRKELGELREDNNNLKYLIGAQNERLRELKDSLVPWAVRK